MARKKDVSKPQILDAAQALLEARGFNGFSTRDLADEVGIASASLHHHFATKGDLAASVIARCRERINARLANIAAEVDGFGLRVRQFTDAMHSESMLLAMLASDFPTLPVVAQCEVRQLFTNVLGWLGRFAMQAKTDRELPKEASVEHIAADVLAQLLGRALIARTGSSSDAPLPSTTWAWQR